MTDPMTIPSGSPDGAIELALRSLHVPAPDGLATRTLVEVGLADAYAPFEGPIGPLFVAWNGRGVSMIGLGPDPDGFERELTATTHRPAQPGELPAGLLGRIERRLAGDRRARVPLDWRGRAPFEREVWAKTLEIPRGEVRPYGWVAAEIGRPRAVRAVGSALGRNPIPLVVPCHRVVRSDGTIGEYGLGGPTNKRAVLEAEGIDLERLARLAASHVRFVGSDTTRIFCLPTCHHARQISDRHRVAFGSDSEATAAGYRACHHCRPAAA